MLSTGSKNKPKSKLKTLETVKSTVTGRQFIQSIQNSQLQQRHQNFSTQNSPISHDSAIIQCSSIVSSKTPKKSGRSNSVSPSPTVSHHNNNNGEKPVLVVPTGDFLPQNLLNTLSIQSLNYNIDTWEQTSKVCPETGETIIETKLISRPMHPYLDTPRTWQREIVFGSGSHFQAPYREKIYHNFEKDSLEVVKPKEQPHKIKKQLIESRTKAKEKQIEMTFHRNTMFENTFIDNPLNDPDNPLNDSLLPEYKMSTPEYNKANEPKNNTRESEDVSSANDNCNIFKFDFKPIISRSATISIQQNCNNNNSPEHTEMSSFVSNRRFSHGIMNNVSKKEIRSRARLIKKQEEKERKRKEREHLNSACELSKSCIENILADEI